MFFNSNTNHSKTMVFGQYYFSLDGRDRKQVAMLDNGLIWLSFDLKYRRIRFSYGVYFNFDQNYTNNSSQHY